MLREIESEIEELQKKAQAYFDNHIKVFVKIFRADGSAQYLNGYILQSPSADFFLVSDQEKPHKQADVIFFHELTKPGAVFDSSSK